MSISVLPFLPAIPDVASGSAPAVNASAASASPFAALIAELSQVETGIAAAALAPTLVASALTPESDPPGAARTGETSTNIGAQTPPPGTEGLLALVTPQPLLAPEAPLAAETGISLPALIGESETPATFNAARHAGTDALTAAQSDTQAPVSAPPVVASSPAPVAADVILAPGPSPIVPQVTPEIAQAPLPAAEQTTPALPQAPAPQAQATPSAIERASAESTSSADAAPTSPGQVAEAPAPVATVVSLSDAAIEVTAAPAQAAPAPSAVAGTQPHTRAETGNASALALAQPVDVTLPSAPSAAPAAASANLQTATDVAPQPVAAENPTIADRAPPPAISDMPALPTTLLAQIAPVTPAAAQPVASAPVSAHPSATNALLAIQSESAPQSEFDGTASTTPQPSPPKASDMAAGSAELSEAKTELPPSTSANANRAAPQTIPAPTKTDAVASGPASATSAISQIAPAVTDSGVTAAVQPGPSVQAAPDAPVRITMLASGIPDLNALAVRIAHRAAAGDSRFDIRLDPPELGRIEVRLDVDRNGQVQTQLSAERPQTLEILQRDAPSLERALRDAGLDSGNLSFSLKGEGRQAQGHAPEGSRVYAASATHTEIDTSTAPLVHADHLWGVDARLDIRV
jgi:flagellar hook-length control protein FliK